MGADFPDHFSNVARSYAEFRPDYPVELFSWVSSLLRSRQRALDCATGNGQAALGLAGFFEEVIAFDASREQIATAAAHPGVCYVIGQAEAIALEDGCIDLIIVAQAAHWFDLAAFYSEAKRVMRASGVILLWCYGVIQFQDQRLQALMREFYELSVGPFWPPERRLIEEHYQTLPFPFVEIEAPQFEIKAHFTLERLTGYLRTWSAAQRFIKATGIDPVVALEGRLAKYWPAEGKYPQIHWPIDIRAGRV
ncbi:MAG TPA: class I SAM-dependent methyltransferase [Verrucomicrobiae bacterium]|nr:class I SAM-dependent methyltransferase [Verrucomicrobiae bacterium]